MNDGMGRVAELRPHRLWEADLVARVGDQRTTGTPATNEGTERDLDQQVSGKVGGGSGEVDVESSHRSETSGCRNGRERPSSVEALGKF
jgi:hypothetical protein